MSDTTSKRTYRGSCICKRVQFEADIDLSQGTRKCNCTTCWKRRLWTVRVAPGDFRSLAGAEELSEHRPGDDVSRGGFCKHCGIRPYTFVDAAEWNDGAFFALNVAALDDLDPAELLAAPVAYHDGLRDNWWNPPAETRHL
jgi:hypothetical protein